MSRGQGAQAWRKPLGGPGYELVELSLQSIKRYGMLEGGEKVLAAVSGGPDSTCLRDVLARVASKLELDVEVAHVDHGLSPVSESVAAAVAQQGAQAGLEVHVVRAPDIQGPNLQARARAFRYSFFEMVARRIGAKAIATGHTLDDRVETTLARLIHGAGTEGVSGIPPVDGYRIRPLIDIRRAETRSYCEELSLPFVDDPANEDVRFERSSVRSEVVAGIEQRWGPGAVRAIARSAERMREDAGALKELAGRLYEDVAIADGSSVRLDLGTMLSMPRALRRRLLERAVGRVRDRSGGIDEALDALDAPGRLPQGHLRFDVAQGAQIVVGSDDLVVNAAPMGE